MSSPDQLQQVYASFVNQYYTTLTKEPKRAYKYYKDESQSTHANSSETLNATGQEKIKELFEKIDFTDFKARLETVDYQTSLNGSILIVAHGSCSFKNGPHKRFVQTFVLAAQQKGYYVLNDVFRFVSLEDNQNKQSSISTSTQNVPSTAVNSTQTIVASAPVENKPTPTPAASATPAPVSKPVEQPKPAPVAAPAKPAEQPKPVETKPVEQPKPAPVAAPTKPAEQPKPKPVEQPKPKQQPKPKPVEQPKPKPVEQPKPKPTGPPTYASILAGQGYVPTENPLGGAGESAQQSADSKVSKQPTKQQDQSSPQQQQQSSQGQQQRRSSRPDSAPQRTERDAEFFKRYVFVAQLPENLSEDELKQAFASFGKVTSADIKREKNAAFVGFDSIETAQAAVKSGKINLKGKSVTVDERRPPKSFSDNNNNKSRDRPFSSRGGRQPRQYNNNNNSNTNNNNSNNQQQN